MREYYFRAVAICLIVICITTGNVNAQENPSNWSMDLLGGAGFTYFGISSEPRPAYGINIRYSLSPVTSVYGSYFRGKFEDTGNNITDFNYAIDFNQFSLRTQINFLRLLGADYGLLQNSALNGIFGAGILAYDSRMDIEQAQQNDQSNVDQLNIGRTTVLTAGGGVRQAISRRIDVIAQFEYNFTGRDMINISDFINENANNGMRINNDFYSFLTAGISIKFGSSREPHASWDRDFTDTQAEHRRQVDNLIELFEGRLIEINDMVDDIESEINRLNDLISDTYLEQLEAVNEKLKELESRLDSLNNIQDTGAFNVTAPDLPQFYVISNSYSNEEKAINHKNELMRIGYSGASVIIDPENNAYNVSYSQYGGFRMARNSLQNIRNNHNLKAWIYTRR